MRSRNDQSNDSFPCRFDPSGDKVRPKTLRFITAHRWMNAPAYAHLSFALLVTSDMRHGCCNTHTHLTPLGLNGQRCTSRIHSLHTGKIRLRSSPGHTHRPKYHPNMSQSPTQPPFMCSAAGSTAVYRGPGPVRFSARLSVRLVRRDLQAVLVPNKALGALELEAFLIDGRGRQRGR